MADYRHPRRTAGALTSQVPLRGFSRASRTAATAQSRPLFTVVICLKNRRALLEDLCGALQDLEEPPGGFEVVFVDDRSYDGSAEYVAGIAGEDPRFHVFQGRGFGLAAARNDGIAHARGRFIAMTDDDVLPEQDWLVRASKVLEEENLRALEGLIAPWSPESLTPPIRRVRNEDGGRFMTANMIYERSVLEQVGGFDETFRPPCFLEDTDLAYRVLDLGIRIPFAPDVRVRHRDAEIRPGEMLRAQRQLRWMALVARKHPARYRRQLRNKLQTLRPGDADLILSGALAVASRRSSTPVKLLAWTMTLVGIRRVLRVAQVQEVPLPRRPLWAVAALAAPAVRTTSLLRGWVRFRKVAL